MILFHFYTPLMIQQLQYIAHIRIQKRRSLCLVSGAQFITTSGRLCRRHTGAQFWRLAPPSLKTFGWTQETWSSSATQFNKHSGVLHPHHAPLSQSGVDVRVCARSYFVSLFSLLVCSLFILLFYIWDNFVIICHFPLILGIWFTAFLSVQCTSTNNSVQTCFDNSQNLSFSESEKSSNPSSL